MPEPRKALVRVRLWRRVLLCVATPALLPLTAAAQAASASAPPVAVGTWLARGFKVTPAAAPVTFFLDLERAGDEFRGQIHWETGGAFASTGPLVPVHGTLLGDSLLLRDSRDAPLLEGRITGSRYQARISIEEGRHGAGAAVSLTHLGPTARLIRFERQ
jgi:hypothetical protein